MVIHLIHNPICAKKFVNPIVTFLNNNGIKSELWLEPWEKTKMFTLSVDCPKSFAWFDLSVNPFIVMTRVFNLWKRFRKVKPTAIHAHQTRASFIPLLAGTFARVPVRIYHNHGTPYVGYRGPLRILLWLLEFLNCRFATHVITVSHPIRGRMIRHGIVKATKCHVLGDGSACGIDLQDFSPEKFNRQHMIESRKALGIPVNSYVVLYVGRPFRRKGFHTLLNAWQNIESLDSENVLLIAGCNDNDVINAVGFPVKNVLTLGYVDNLHPCYAACDTVVLPSYHEGFPYSLLEGAASGKPLIGSDIPGIDSIIINNENGLLVPPRDSLALSNAFVNLRDHQSLRKRFGYAGRRYVEQYFSREESVQSLIDYYKKIGVMC